MGHRVSGVPGVGDVGRRFSVRGVSEPAHLTATRVAYDTVAADYADLLRDELAEKSWDRALLATFAELVWTAGGRLVADLGCGSGRVTAHLHDLVWTSSASTCPRRWWRWPVGTTRACASTWAR